MPNADVFATIETTRGFLSNGISSPLTIFGGADNDELHGGDDDDVLTGDGGVDLLFGDAGVDTLNGDAGVVAVMWRELFKGYLGER